MIKSTLSIAPMMEYTDRHFRYMMRFITKKTILYTEMVTTKALLRGDKNRFLQYNREEHPIVLQLGGDDPAELALCCKMAEDFGYDEVNLNVGCPSEKVQKGNFGAILMEMPEQTAHCIEAMKKSVSIPIGIKHRIGTNHINGYKNLQNFVKLISRAGVDRFIIHARIAVLEGLSTKENRKVPPLDYEQVYKIKRDFSDKIIEINGGYKTFDEVKKSLKQIDGVMIGREAYENPILFEEADEEFFQSENQNRSRLDILLLMKEYIQQQISLNVPSNRIIKHLLSLYKNQKGSKKYRQILSDNMHKNKDNTKALDIAIDHIKSHSIK